MKIKFLGASKTVTGSCYLVHSADSTFLIDCGMFQGPNVEALNHEVFKFNPTEIDFVVLTHAHLDHCGLLPKLIQQGFKGEIYTSVYTSQITENILLDSAKIQQENSIKQNMPNLYNTQDVINTVNKFVTLDIDKEFIRNHVTIMFRRASHILGAVSVEIYADSISITFSGDLGRTQDRLIEQYSNNYNSTDYYLSEALYGNKNHEKIGLAKNKLSTIINNTFSRNGIVMIPVFAIHRSLQMIDTIQELINQNMIPDSTKMVLDSPLAIKVASVYSASNSRLNLSNFPNLIYKNQDLHRHNKGKNRIILAGGGMINGGKILNYLKKHISHKSNSLVFVGYQAEETLGRQILEGAKSISIDNEVFTVAAEIHFIDGFSAHADQSELLWWFSRYDSNKVKKVFLVHAEPEKSEAFKTELLKKYPNIEVYIPEMYYEEELLSN